MKKIAYYAEKSLIDNIDLFADTEAKDRNREARGIASRGYVVRKEDGIGVIAVNDAVYSEPTWWGIDYKSLAMKIESLEADEEIKAIVLDINSVGGAVNGLFDITEMINALDKPIYAYTSGTLASASYTIASATRAIYGTESANIGSVGVYMSFMDDSEYMKKMGIKEITFYGQNSDKKNLDPESREGKEVYQAEINELEDILVRNIAKYRGVTSEDVLANFGHGLMFRGNEALSRGMIDGVVSNFDEFIEIIKNADNTAINGGFSMAKENERKEVVLANSVEAIDPEFLAQIKADMKAEMEKEAEAKATEQAQIAVNAERERVAELNRYASLPQAEISALAEKAKADGTSVAEFKEQFNALAFELFQKNEFASNKNAEASAIEEEAKESAKIEASVEQTVGTPKEKTDIEKGKDLAEKVNARLKR